MIVAWWSAKECHIGADSNRHSSLDEKKRRAAGRAKQNERAEIRESMGAQPRRQVAGADGETRRTVLPGAQPKTANVNRSSRPARKRGA